MSHDFIQNAVNALYQSNELMALKGELANLKAERDQLKADLEKSDGVVWTLSVENARLKDEVEKWEKNTQLMGRQLNDELEQVARLKAEVDRLTNAGDAMALCFNCPTCAKNWHTAKGVQS